MAATFCAFIGDDLAAKKAGEYHVELMHRGLDQVGVDMATEWAAPSSQPHEAFPMMALYENHARLDVVAGEWHHITPPAPAPAQNAAPWGLTVATPLQQPIDRIRVEIAALEARLSQLWGPSTPLLSLRELQRVVNTQLHYAWHYQLVETFVIFLRTKAP